MRCDCGAKCWPLAVQDMDFGGYTEINEMYCPECLVVVE